MTGFEHNGHTVTVNDTFLFEVAGTAFLEESTWVREFQSAREARDAIDRRVKAQEKELQARKKIAVQAIDDLGNPCTIRGINANTSLLTSAPAKPNGRGTLDIFPPVPWLIVEVKRWRTLQQEAIDMGHRLGAYIVRSSRGYGRMEAHNYDQMLANFQHEFDERLAKAEADAPRDPG